MNSSFKKYWYKFTNRKKYQIYRNQIIKDKELKDFKNNLEKYLNEVQIKIKTKKNLSFLHSGTTGDVINALPVIKELAKTHKCSLYLQVERPYEKEHPNNYCPFLLPQHLFEMLLPLLKSQEYLFEVKKFENEEIDINFDKFREFPVSLQFDNIRYYFHVSGMQPDILNPYLNVKTHSKIKDKIVIHRTFRYRNHLINYNFLKKYEDLIFIGTKKEYDDLKKSVNNLEFYDCRDHLEMAMIIKSSRFLIGNSSIGHAIAEGLKTPRILEASPEFPAAYPHGEDAYDFYFQNHFEKWCSYLENKYKK